jgi:hypothetical protein
LSQLVSNSFFNCNISTTQSLNYISYFLDNFISHFILFFNFYIWWLKCYGLDKWRQIGRRESIFLDQVSNFDLLFIFNHLIKIEWALMLLTCQFKLLSNQTYPRNYKLIVAYCAHKRKKRKKLLIIILDFYFYHSPTHSCALRFFCFNIPLYNSGHCKNE